MSNQNPIHRDKGRRDGEQPFRDNKEAMAQQEAEIERNAPLPEDAGDVLTEEERDAAQEQAAAKRFNEINKESSE